jgi:hypothetical protein
MIWKHPLCAKESNSRTSAKKVPSLTHKPRIANIRNQKPHVEIAGSFPFQNQRSHTEASRARVHEALE